MNDITAPPKKLRGWARHNELKKQDAADCDEIIKGLLDGLGCEPTMDDRVSAETRAKLVIQARIYERRGQLKKALDVRNTLLRAERGAIKAKPTKPKKSNPAADAREWLDSFKKPASEVPA